MTLAEMMKDKKLILASASPRRKQLIAGLDIPFECRPLENHTEEFPPHLKQKDIAEYLAASKSYFFTETNKSGKNEIILTADTIVWFRDKVLNKPKDKEEAFSMLKELSANTHEVYTGVCLAYRGNRKVFSSVSVVEFSELSDEEIYYYINNYKPFDKAGSYGAQEWIGYVAIKKIEGSFFNVMGLPVRMVYDEMKKLIQKHG